MIGDRWGVSEVEVDQRYPCDEIVARPTLAAWRGVTVHAEPERVWPWVTQVRLAPYSYDWVDNLGRQSPRDLRGLPDPVVGESFTATAGRSVGRVEAVVPGESLTGRIGVTLMSYVLVPVAAAGGEGSTRLLLKIVMEGFAWAAPLLSVGDLVMARKQLLTWKALAEGAVG